jgi:hypothetical protein
MCWQCDHPEATGEDWLDYLRGVISQCGWAVQGVESSPGQSSWAYTVGLTAHGQPELLVTGLCLPDAGDLLNMFAAHLTHAEAPEPGERIELDDGRKLEVVEICAPMVHLVAAFGIYGGRVRARQLVYTDDNGIWPWDKEYRNGRGGQPVLGARASPRS